MGTNARVGFKDLHFALLSDETDGSFTYETPEKISGAMTGTVTPGVNWANLYTDDSITETAQSMGVVEISLDVADLDPTSYALLMGTEVNADGAVIDNTSDKKPYGALGFRSERADGTYEYVWLLKGKFGVPEDSYSTKSESIEFQSQTIAGRFVARSDGKWRARVVEGTEAAATDVIDTWFDDVYDAETAAA
ncbi:phage tail protein [Salibacterium salarium]|uniref:Phage tail protein n=1 Tax=Salibacterium salarium TaxID=284579 RepID=A0A3R9RD29_9BACI|nr:major tail protein [Salibacterium salarium]RSL32668.1 phage tail protein [Salibacterium salarium]